MTRAGRVAGSVLLLAVVGCGSTTADPAASSPARVRAALPVAEADDLVGRTFSSISVTVDGEPYPLVKGTALTFEFGIRARVEVSAGCDGIRSLFSVRGGRLHLTGGVVTERTCHTGRAAQDEWVAALLVAEPTVRFDGPGMTLTTDDTTVVLREVTPANRPLAGTTWAVTTFHEDGFTTRIQPAPRTELRFGPDTVEVDAGCNAGAVGYTAAEETIRFGELVLGDVRCDPDTTAAEQALAAVLRDEVRYLAREGLDLLHPSGNGLTGSEKKAR